MTKIRSIVRLILACFTTVAAISILATIIYFYQDYERNVILNTNIDVIATCVRVPVFNSHAESINVEFKNEFDIDNLKIRN